MYNDTAKGIELAREMDRYGVDLLGEAECRYTGSNYITIGDPDATRPTFFKKYKLINSNIALIPCLSSS